ncbi:RDD family protein [Telmatospirillum sp. J64-1]|uniref:RDD family protein n=1 Tax=Telmatospirillum sp. J64-1 TaxID=2502183 RepID=UPI0021070B69|nr:RDD family protein [Telmatospirillum sp. J64-1]
MSGSMPSFENGSTSPRQEAPDPVRQPQYYDGVTLKRCLAYLLDAVILFFLIAGVWLLTGMATLLTFGLLAPFQALATALTPLAYHILLIGGRRSATLGMRVMGLHVRSLVGPAPVAQTPPTLLQAAIQTICFYGSLALTGALILLVVFFNPRRRTLHDFLSGTIVVNALSSETGR